MEPETVGLEVEDLVEVLGDPGRLAFVVEIGWRRGDLDSGGETGPDDENLYEWGERSPAGIGFQEQAYVERFVAKLSFVSSSRFEDTAILPISGLKLVDRRLVHGDIVSSTTQQQAVVCDVSVILTVRRLRNDELTGPPFEIDFKQLSYIGGLLLGSLVFKENWLGYVSDFDEKLTLEFDDGAVGILTVDSDNVIPSNRRGTAKMQGTYYPGQRVNLPSFALKEMFWARGYSSSSTAVVKGVNISNVNVKWVATAANGRETTMPTDYSKKEDLSMLGAYRWWWKAGDRGCIRNARSPVKDQSTPEQERGSVKLEGGYFEGEYSSSGQSPPGSMDVSNNASGRFLRAYRRIKPHNERRIESAEAVIRETGSLDVVEIMSTRTTVDLLWQDGTKSKCVPSVNVFPIPQLGAHDFFPGRFVRRTNEESNDQKETICGVVKSVNQTDRTASVVWEKPHGKGLKKTFEDVSVYDLTLNLDYDLNIGDLVVRIFKDNEDVNKGWVGEIAWTGLGTIEVVWNDNTRTREKPDSLIVLYRDDVMEEDEFEYDEMDGVEYEHMEEDDRHSFDLGYDSGRASGDEQTEEHSNNMDSSHADTRDADEGRTSTEVDTSSVGVFSKILRVMSAVRSAVRGRASVGSVPVPQSEPAQTATPEIHSAETPMEVETDLRGAESENEGKTDSEDGLLISRRASDPDVSKPSQKLFPKLTVLEDQPEGHHFLSQFGENLHRLGPIVRREWEQLTNSKVDGIHVVAYESRLDLLRIAIVGPEGTPYEDCLFFFDLQLSESYPNRPPHVYFYSHGRRLNPNLYEDGKVCLSILGTWEGDEVERWNPQTSNILRVLLSIQAMVFTEKPYYNEAGFETQVGSSEGDNKSRLYNESTVLLTLRHALSCYQPGGHSRDFEELVRKHFRERRARIIARCKQMVGDVQYSVGFRKSLEGLIPRLESYEYGTV
ncbi:hypothetical protein NDN08_004364 [Rhodosorus marinus]|uniref:UBC core domain-containing protein n=1 Tax=Rhodosorus marinus TaxID=101924 RepID=A0AAV8UL28_9RHOD|nr:hypothetical protein NDN08_004364 [Rhodosorus marinus]